MQNSLLQTIELARENRWCVKPYCTTCGSGQFRSQVASLPDLQDSLEALSPQSLVPFHHAMDALVTVAIGVRVPLDWDAILRQWLHCVQTGVCSDNWTTKRNHLDFADHVVFYILGRVLSSVETRTLWYDYCAEQAVKQQHTSLMESLIRVLGARSRHYPSLLETARTNAPASPRLKNALRFANLLPATDAEEQIKRQTDIEAATHHIRGAIRRADLLAVEALLAKEADISRVDRNYTTALQQAQQRVGQLSKQLARMEAIVERLESHLEKGEPNQNP